ncbi:hypothetical protein ABIB15_002311 [Marisediminicola sp. UYEF4]|uniref:rhamnosyltransferase WsaF family glycosyltransferase n=1 Tax=Marisediminicola sp. UYEF4 TaxID=1756384 RepID=UPI0033909A38
MPLLSNASKVVRAFRQHGISGVAEKLTRRANERWGALGEPLHLLSDDVVDSSSLGSPPPAAPKPFGDKLTIGWVITPPGPASGGHTTIFRFVEALESAGHTCVLFVYDGQGGDARQYESVIRTWWPKVRADVRTVRNGMRGMDAYVATAWMTAHVLARHANLPGERFYLIQDFEPYFYPRGSAYELAEDTYRFGFRPITVGHMVADELQARFGLESIVAEFGCDTATYRVTNTGERRGVVFYAKPGTARRGYELGVLALELLNRARPEIEIHTFGVEARRLPFAATIHSHVEPDKLNDLYNQCGAGLALSFTNISLIANELLAAGVVPVVNDWTGTRADLANAHVAWTRPNPRAIAGALAEAVDRQHTVGAAALRSSLGQISWRPAQAAVVEAVQSACATPATHESTHS